MSEPSEKPLTKISLGRRLKALSERRRKLLAITAIPGTDDAVRSKEDLDELERLDKLKAMVRSEVSDQRRAWEIAALVFTAILLLASSYFRVPSIPIDIDVRASEVRFEMTTGREKALIPGENGQILELKSATISGMSSATVDGIPASQDPLVLEQLRTSNATPAHTTSSTPVQLQEIALSGNSQFKLTTAVAYSGAARGIRLETSGAALVSALLTEPASPLPHPVTTEGKELRFELFPADSNEPLVIFRNAHASKIVFDKADQSTLFGGTVYVSGGDSTGIPLRPSDLLKLESGSQHLFLRELSLVKGELHVILSTADATLVTVGGDATRNLRPTWFQWVLAKWPNQLYATLTAWIGIWLALRRWWSSTE